MEHTSTEGQGKKTLGNTNFCAARCEPTGLNLALKFACISLVVRTPDFDSGSLDSTPSSTCNVLFATKLLVLDDWKLVVVFALFSFLGRCGQGWI